MEENYEYSLCKIEEKIKRFKNKNNVPAIYQRFSSVGVTFERSLGVGADFFEIPDYEGVEVKCKLRNSHSLITLFNATPDSYLYEIKRIKEKYGCPDKINREYKVFNVKIDAVSRKFVSNKYIFRLKVDRNKKQLILIVRNFNGEIIDDKTAWTFELLEEKVNRKLKMLLIVYTDKFYKNNLLYFNYNEFKLYKLKGINEFIDAIESGVISITFKISVYKSEYRKGKIHDRGTGFDIDVNHIESVFTLVKNL